VVILWKWSGKIKIIRFQELTHIYISKELYVYMKTKTATTVKIEKPLYDSFKILGIQNGLTLQTFVEKCVQLYVNNTIESSSFRSVVNNFSLPILSTSGSINS